VTDIAEHHLTVSRTARYFLLGASGPAVTEVWFALHGYAQLGSAFARHCLPLASAHRLVVVPEALSRFYLGDHTSPAGPDNKIGASWMTREDRLADIADYVRYLDLLYDTILDPLARERVVLHVLGFSQGTATAARWLTRGHARARRLIAWGAPLPSDLEPGDADRLRHCEIVLVAGSEDQYLTPKVVAADEARLTRMGAPFRVVRYAGGHNLNPEVLKALAGGGGS
jgi:predicted esterase